jgi:hypothetical protein
MELHRRRGIVWVGRPDADDGDALLVVDDVEVVFSLRWDGSPSGGVRTGR